MKGGEEKSRVRKPIHPKQVLSLSIRPCAFALTEGKASHSLGDRVISRKVYTTTGGVVTLSLYHSLSPPPSQKECKSCSHGKSFKHFSNV